MQGAWDVYREELGVVPPDHVLALRNEYDRSDVDGFWNAWSTGAEEGLFRAYCRAGGPTTAGVDAFFGWGAVRIRQSVGGGRGTGASRLYRDVVDASSSQFFVNSSLAPVLLFRWRLKSVADVLRGVQQHGFTQTRWNALHRYWGAVCRQGPCGPVGTLEPWVDWIHLDLHGFYKWVFDALGVLLTLLSKLLLTVGRLGYVGGPLGLGKILALGRVLGSGLTLPPRPLT